MSMDLALNPGSALVSEQNDSPRFLHLPVEVVILVSNASFAALRLNLLILYTNQVCSFSTPADLLSLSRTCKDVRSYILQKSWKDVWSSAEQVAGMPACPPDLTHPQYASLLYDRYCTVRLLILKSF